MSKLVNGGALPKDVGGSSSLFTTVAADVVSAVNGSKLVVPPETARRDMGINPLLICAKVAHGAPENAHINLGEVPEISALVVVRVVLSTSLDNVMDSFLEVLPRGIEEVAGRFAIFVSDEVAVDHVAVGEEVLG